MKSIICLVGSVQAMRISHPDVPKALVPTDFNHDELGWSGEYAGAEVGITPNYHEYNREIPAQFQDLNDDDRFTRSMITDFAFESRNEAGQPSGKFYLDEAQARKASE